MIVLSIGSDVANYLVSIVTSQISSSIATGDSYLARHLYATISSIGDPNLMSKWFVASYSHVVVATGTVALVAIVFAAISSVISGGSFDLIRLCVVTLPAVGIGSAAILPTLVLAIHGADSLSQDLFSSFAISDNHASKYSTVFMIALNGSVPPIISILTDVAYLVFALVLELEFALRAAAIYMVVAVLPFAMALYLNPRTRTFLFRLIELCGALIVSKIVIALGLGLTAGLTQTQASSALGSSIEATAILLVCVLSPFSVIRLLSGLENGLTPGMERVTAHTLSTVQRSAVNMAMQSRGSKWSQGDSDVESYLKVPLYDSPFIGDSNDFNGLGKE